MKNKEMIQILENRLNIQSKLLDNIITKLELDNEQEELKQLDQSAFDHPYVVDRFKYVALNADGQAVFFESKPVISNCLDIWVVHTGSVLPMLKGYDASNWQTSLIKRESNELTGSELCKAMLARGDKYVMCLVSDECEESAKSHDRIRVIYSYGADYFEDTSYDMWYFATPINNQGEPLTSSDVGL